MSEGNQQNKASKYLKSKASKDQPPAAEQIMPSPKRRVFIGHGGSAVWKDLRHFLSDRLHIDCDEFNREPVAGRSTKERLEEMLAAAGFAFLVLTAEDEQPDGSKRARENVITKLASFKVAWGLRGRSFSWKRVARDFPTLKA
jgi:predicted nucleotide-binding protein